MAPDPPSLRAPTNSQASRTWYTHSYDHPLLYHLVRTGTPLLPRRLRFGMARIAALIFRQLMPREYAAAQSNITRILPDAAPDMVAQTARTLFRNFTYYFADLLTLNRQPLPVQQRYIHSINGFEQIEAILASDQGFVAVTAHLGNWELAGRLLSPFGKQVNVLVAPEQQPAIQALLRDKDRPPGLNFIFNDSIGAFMQLLMALRRGEVAAIQIDRGTGHRSDIPVNFFNAPVAFPSGPFRLASAARVPVIPFFCLMRPDYQYDIFIGNPISVERGGEIEALHTMIRVLEHYVAMAPDQWFNFYDVWQPLPA